MTSLASVRTLAFVLSILNRSVLQLPETMGKYDNLKSLKKTKARNAHVCNKCVANIFPGDYYYKEHIEDRFLHTLHNKKFCLNCAETTRDTNDDNATPIN